MIFVAGVSLNDTRTTKASRLIITFVTFLILVITILKMLIDMVLYSEDYFNMRLIELNIVEFEDLAKLNIKNKIRKILSYYGCIYRDYIFHVVGRFKKSGRN